MSDEIRLLLAALATCPVLAVVITFLMGADSGSNLGEVAGVAAFLTAVFVLVVLTSSAMYGVWTWAL